MSNNSQHYCDIFHATFHQDEGQGGQGGEGSQSGQGGQGSQSGQGGNGDDSDEERKVSVYMYFIEHILHRYLDVELKQIY